MLNVRLTHVFIENTWRDRLSKLFKKPRWYSLVALDLMHIPEDISKPNANVAEWFYLVMCSEEYFKKPRKSGPVLDQKYTFIRDKIDLVELEEIAREKMSRVHAQDWDEFYIQMDDLFLYEDSERLR